MKAGAAFDFNYYLLTKRQEFFTPRQQRQLLRNLNNSYLNDKARMDYFVKISKLHFRELSIKSYLAFLKSVVAKMIGLRKENR